MSRIDWASLDAQLRELVARGLTTHQLACALGLSRNAVTGRCTRLQLPLRRRLSPPRPRWPDSEAGMALSGQCFGGDPDPGDGGVCRASRPATEMQTATVLGNGVR